jgi:gluconokinase
MSAGIALDDADRWPWLDRVAAEIAAQQAGSDVVVCACSALKRRYRDRLRAGLTFPIHFICLTADRAVLQQRVAHRPGHYWPASLLDSQLEILELPAPDENSIVVSSELKPEAIVERVCSELGINHAWHG